MVTQTFEAVYDGKFLRPKKRLILEPNLRASAVKARSKKKKSALNALNGKLSIKAEH